MFINSLQEHTGVPEKMKTLVFTCIHSWFYYQQQYDIISITKYVFCYFVSCYCSSKIVTSYSLSGFHYLRYTV